MQNTSHKTTTTTPDLEASWSDLEHKHQLRCLWSEVIGNRTIQVECMWVPAAGVTIMVTKHYDRPIPRSYGKSRPWPKMIAHYAYFPAGGVTWGEMDQALTDLAKASPKPTEAKVMGPRKRAALDALNKALGE